MNYFKKLLVATLTISSFFITSLPVVADDVSEAVRHQPLRGNGSLDGRVGGGLTGPPADR